MNKIPICLIGPNNYFKGGLTTYTMNLAHLFAQNPIFNPALIFLNKFVPKKLFPGRNRNIKDHQLQIPVDVKYFSGLDWYIIPSLVQSLKFVSYLPNKQTFIVQWWTSSVLHIYLLFISLLKILRPQSKIVLEIHEIFDPLEQRIFFLHLYVKFVLPLLLKKVDFILFHSPQEALDFSYRFHVDLSKIYFVKHIFPIPDKPMIFKGKKYHTGVKILFFGLIRDYKGVPLLVEAFNNALHEIEQPLREKSTLQIVGEIWDQKELLFSKIKKSDFKLQISLQAEYVPDTEIEHIFSDADLLVLPYIRGTQSGVLNLGMSYELPIITTNVGGFADLLSKYEPKLIIEPNNELALRNALKLMISNIDRGLLPTPLENYSYTQNVNKKYMDTIIKINLG